MDESWQPIIDADESSRSLIDKLVDEGRRIRRVPWCADGYAEGKAAERLDLGYGITERETMAETKARRERERKFQCIRLRIRLADLSRLLHGEQLSIDLPEDATVVAIEEPMHGRLQGWFYAYVSSESFPPPHEGAEYLIRIMDEEGVS